VQKTIRNEWWREKVIGEIIRSGQKNITDEGCLGGAGKKSQVKSNIWSHTQLTKNEKGGILVQEKCR